MNIPIFPKELFPFEYRGGGYFRETEVPNGKHAIILHGEQALQYFYFRMKGHTHVESLSFLKEN